jgi:hypothetical protein
VIRTPHALRLATGLLVLAAAATGCHRETPVSAMRMIPAEASTVIRLDVKRLRGTYMHQRLVAWLDDNDYFRWKIDDLEKKTGVNLLRDVDGLVLGAADAPTEAARGDFGIVVMGRFDAGRVATWYEAQVRKKGGAVKTTSYAGQTIRSAPDESTNLVTVSSHLAIFASKGWVRRMLDLSKGKGQNVSARPEMSPLLAKLPADRIIGIVMHISEAQRRAAAAKELPFATMSGGVVTIDSSAGVEISARLEQTTAEGARTFADKLTGLIKNARSSALAGKAGLATTLDQIKTRVEGQACVADLKLTKPQFDDTIAAVRKLMTMPAATGGSMGGLGRGLNIPGVLGGDPTVKPRMLLGPQGGGGTGGTAPPAPTPRP